MSVILILKRRIGEKIKIDHEVQITVLEVDEQFVTLGFRPRTPEFLPEPSVSDKAPKSASKAGLQVH